MDSAIRNMETMEAISPPAVDDAAYVALTGVNKSYGSGIAATRVLHDVNLRVRRGEFVAVVGFSGSGKTTLMNLLAGLVMPDTGHVRVDGKSVTGPDPERGLVFQNYSLLPWLSVVGNVNMAVSKVFADEEKKRRKERVLEAIGMVNLGAALEKKPGELSGGMRQRVSVARTLSTRPRLLLLDEPLSALDAMTRGVIQDQILEIWERERQTIILITNDLDEALYMADRVIPLTPGPDATLGREFVVPQPRPRDRAKIFNDPEMRRIREEVVRILITHRREAATVAQESADTLPDAQPLDLDRPGGAAMSPFRPRKRYSEKAKESNAHLEIWNLGKSYPKLDGTQAVIVRDFNLRARHGEFITIIGHSGCGKSTVLSMVAGLSTPSTGGMILEGREIEGAGPDRAMVFQSPCLLPWLTAMENVTLGLQQVFSHVSRKEREAIARYYLNELGLSGALQKRPDELSQGMRQRVGLARAFALMPKMLLLDEPFGMLDKLTKHDLQGVLLDLWNRTRLTALMVTHDVDEAIYLSDRVVLMSNGPEAGVGEILEIAFPRPRQRQAILEDSLYSVYREHLLSFLEERSHLHEPPVVCSVAAGNLRGYGWKECAVA